jgi:hypothetical protein
MGGEIRCDLAANSITECFRAHAALGDTQRQVAVAASA